MDQPVASSSKGLQQKRLPADTVVKVVNNSNSDVYENVDISEDDDICEIEETNPILTKRIRSGRSNDSSSVKIVLQTQQDRCQKRIHSTKPKRIIGSCELR
jgi:hypothetical protein